MTHSLSNEERAICFAELYASSQSSLKQAASSYQEAKAEAEEYLNKADLAYQDAKKFKIINELGQEMHMSDVTYQQARFDQTEIIKKDDYIKLTILPKCLHCSNVAIASCLVEDPKQILQIVCEDHITDIILWRKHAV